VKASINYYRCELNGYGSLSQEESVSLGRRLAAGDQTARELLIKSGLKLVYRLAQDHQHMLNPASTVSLNDLIQEGNLGLIHAADSYDYSKNIKFSHYAYTWILQGIRKCLRGQLHAVHVPGHLISEGAKLRKTYYDLCAILGDRPSLDQLANALGIDSKRVARVLQATAHNKVLLSSKLDGHNDSSTYADTLVDESWLDGFKILHDTEGLNYLLASLKPKEQAILSSYFGFDGPETNLTDLAYSYGLCPERIRQIFKKALTKVKIKLVRAKLQENS